MTAPLPTWTCDVALRSLGATSKVVRLAEPAIRQARRSNMRCKHGAALFVKNRLVAVGYNQELGTKRSRHAEQVVLAKIPKGTRPEDMVLVVVRINRYGRVMPSAPCPSCAKAIERAGIRRVLHT